MAADPQLPGHAWPLAFATHPLGQSVLVGLQNAARDAQGRQETRGDGMAAVVSVATGSPAFFPLTGCRTPSLAASNGTLAVFACRGTLAGGTLGSTGQGLAFLPLTGAGAVASFRTTQGETVGLGLTRDRVWLSNAASANPIGFDLTVSPPSAKVLTNASTLCPRGERVVSLATDLGRDDVLFGGCAATVGAAATSFFAAPISADTVGTVERISFPSALTAAAALPSSAQPLLPTSRFGFVAEGGDLFNGSHSSQWTPSASLSTLRAGSQLAGALDVLFALEPTAASLPAALVRFDTAAAPRRLAGIPIADEASGLAAVDATHAAFGLSQSDALVISTVP